jgi:hypothetical protein
MIAIEDVMAGLSLRRPVFCSEADFQHELAHELRLRDPDTGVRLEYPLGVGIRGAVDIQLLGQKGFALELKYLCKRLSVRCGEEDFSLRQHSAHDIRRYDVCKDIKRMEAYADRTGHPTGVLVLSNDPAYWLKRRRTDTVDAGFDLSDARALSGLLQWTELAGAGTTKGREASLDIRSEYTLTWRDYSDLSGPAGRFRYLWVPITPAA